MPNKPPSAIRRPPSLWFVRHGESTSNIARRRAESEKLPTIDFPEREPDVPLSEAGVRQSVALGEWFARQTEKPTVIVASPFLRASETARLIAANAGLGGVEIFYDERLRERELGIFDRLTKLGALEKYPEECAKRELWGKFYYRPLGGESWADVALRVRGIWRELREKFAGENILVVTHEVVIHVFRYVLENLTEAEILAIDRARDVENCGITSYRCETETGRFLLEADNFRP